jgi:hypothetical protein
MSTDPRGPHRVRASDAEREQYAQILRTAMGEGRLTLEEGEERLGQVYAAKYRDELSPLTADLPDGGRQASADQSEARAAFRTGMASHAGLAAVVAVVAVVAVGLWALSGAHFFWPLVPLLFLWFGVRRRLGWRRGHAWSATGCGRGGRPPWAGRGAA